MLDSDNFLKAFNLYDEANDSEILKGFKFPIESYSNIIIPDDLNEPMKFLVYGTLRTGEHNYMRILSGNTVSEEIVTVQGYLMYSNSGFPYAVPSTIETENIVATLVELDPSDLIAYNETVRRLDALEGFRGYQGGYNHYNRVIANYLDETGATGEAYIYIANETRSNGLALIESGDWMHRKGKY